METSSYTIAASNIEIISNVAAISGTPIVFKDIALSPVPTFYDFIGRSKFLYVENSQFWEWKQVFIKLINS
jgi:hypothetical protein